MKKKRRRRSIPSTVIATNYYIHKLNIYSWSLNSVNSDRPYLDARQSLNKNLLLINASPFGTPLNLKQRTYKRNPYVSWTFLHLQLFKLTLQWIAAIVVVIVAITIAVNRQHNLHWAYSSFFSLKTRCYPYEIDLKKFTRALCSYLLWLIVDMLFVVMIIITYLRDIRWNTVQSFSLCFFCFSLSLDSILLQ